jgi:protein tyrosine phosphatase (PTP) superfamily phosphohydrolase (DUF442 family)
MAASAFTKSSETMVKNFRFEEEGKIARSGAPQTAAEVDWLKEQGIRAVVSLHPVPEEASARMAEVGIEWRPILTSDFRQGAPAGFVEALDFIGERAEKDPSVLIHCQGGGGRAGTAYASYLLRKGMAIDEVLKRVDGVEREDLKGFLQRFAAGLGQRG